ncbi:MAG: hypothetical protein JST68_14220, partial [Bacteroidetes bacterium]|nr:hypothetical protein [Bacteroidota bacterium]
ALFFIMGYSTSQIVTPGSGFWFAPPNFGIGLAGVYLVWFSVVAVMYWPCKWFSAYKKTHKQWWLSYV